jgi:hypothetical protein
MSPDPWFSEQVSGLLGGLLGGGYCGVLVGAIGGGVCAPLAAKGKGRVFVHWYTMSLAAIGAVLLITGIVALVMGQPYAVWYPFVLCGALGAGLGVMLFVTCRRQYQMAEHRKLDAQELRRATG